MRARLAGVGLVAALAALGCDDVSTVAHPEVPLWVHHPGNAVHVYARRDLTAPSRKLGEAYERGRPAIDAAHRRVFVGSRDHGLYALHAGDLSTLWRFQTAGAVQSEPLYDAEQDVVYFGSNDGALYKVRAVDGAMIWRFASNAEITRKPILHRGAVYFVNANDTLVSLDPATGKLRWYQHREPAAGMEISGYAGVSAFEERVYTAFSDGVVMAYKADNGAEAWPGLVDLAADAEQTRGEEIRYFDVDTTPVVGRAGDTDVVFVASYEGGVHALDAMSGARVWTNDAAIGVTELIDWSSPARPREGEPLGSSVHRMVIASSGLSGLWGIDPDTGAERWRRDLPAGGITRAAPWSGALLIGTTRYGLFLVHPLDGGVLDGVYEGGAFAADPVTFGRRAFVLSNEGVFFGLSLEPPG